MKKGTSSTLLLALAAQLTCPLLLAAPARAQIEERTAEVQTKKSSQTLAVSEALKLNLSLLIASTYTTQKMQGLVEIDPVVAKRWEAIRNAYLASFNTALGGVALYTGQESAKSVESLHRALTVVLQTSANAKAKSAAGIEGFSRITGLDVVIRNSKESAAYERILEPMINFLRENRARILSASAGSAGAVAGASYFHFSTSSDVMSSDVAREILGQNDMIRSRVDGVVNDLSVVLNLDASAQAKLRVAIYDEAIRQGVENKFSPDRSKYSLDLVSLMKSNRIIPAEAALAMGRLQSLSITTSLGGAQEVNLTTLVSENVDSALALAALLESQLKSGRIRDPQLRSELERMLGSVTIKLSLIGYNLRN